MTNVLIGVNNKDGSSLVCSKVGVVYGSQNVGLSPQDWCLFFWASLCLTDGTVVLASGGRERVDDMQQRATGWNQTSSRCGKDKDFVHGAPVLPGELMGVPTV